MTKHQALGLRERKNQLTRETITRAACELILERGYDRATIPEIAERATVSARTVHTWFRSKEEIVFGPVNEPLDRLEAELRSGAGNTVDRFERWLQGEGAPKAQEDQLRTLRLEALRADPHLRALERERLNRLDAALTAAVAADAGVPLDNLAAGAFAAATVSVLLALRARFSARNAPEHPAIVAEGFALLRTLHAVVMDAADGVHETPT